MGLEVRPSGSPWAYICWDARPAHLYSIFLFITSASARPTRSAARAVASSIRSE